MPRMMKAVALVASCIVAAPASAMDAISSRDAFMQTLDGRDLRIGLYGLTLSVRDDGSIRGRAMGRDVTGDWTWQEGYFCREMKWGSRDIPFNCQLVQADGTKMRFTTDRGAGDSADFRLR